jgi:predicted amidohydrolase
MPLSLAAAQPGCVALDLETNVARHAEAVRQAAARVVVFPEMSLTGYEFSAPDLDPGDVRLQPLARACEAAGAVAFVGAPVADGAGRRFIAVLAVDGSGARVAYRKLWLGDEEAEHFTPGPGPAVEVVDGWRLGLAICKDTGIPRHVADTAAPGIDVYLAGTLMLPQETDEQDARARRNAMAHDVCVAVASFAGPTGEGYDRSAGCSGIWAPDGRLLDQTGPEPGGLARATLSATVSPG